MRREAQQSAVFSPEVALLTGGGDRPYALGLGLSLAAAGVAVDFLGSDGLLSAELQGHPRVRFLNVRGSQRFDASLPSKIGRILRYYWRLVSYAARSEAPLFHLLWNNKFQFIDRSLLMIYYRWLGKRIIITVHNVNTGVRDGRDSAINRLTLRWQYRLADHLIVHTALMKEALHREFGVPAEKVTILPFPVNDTTPDTDLSRDAARERLGISPSHKCVLFFGNIAPYKGLDCLLDAVMMLKREVPELRLVVVGARKCDGAYWDTVQKKMSVLREDRSIITRLEYIPDEDTEIYFKAADVLTLPYTYIYQSGVLFLGYRYGLPVVASDVGEMRRDVLEGQTGFICKPGDAVSLQQALRGFFSSALYENSELTGARIREHAHRHNSWTRAAQIMTSVYQSCRQGDAPVRPPVSKNDPQCKTC